MSGSRRGGGIALLFSLGVLLGGGLLCAQSQVYKAKREKLQQLPSGLMDRADWTEVDLRANRLSRFPVELAGFDSLRLLRLGGNPLDWPDTLSGFERLEYLDLWDTDVDAVPVQIQGFKALKRLDLRNTYLDEKNREALEALFPGVEIMLSERCDCRPKR